MNEVKLAHCFAQKHLPFKPKWLSACIECLKTTAGPKIQRSEAIFDHVLLQFLYSNLCDSLDPVMKIPDHAAKLVIIKRMIFQMISYTNISVSLYEQLSENTRHTDDLSWFHGGGTKNHDEENRDLEKDHAFDENNNVRPQLKKKRGMLKLVLTDGVNTIKAVELEEIFEETCLVPGVKILLTGHVRCRRGVLLLDNSNCDLLGGRIQSMDFEKDKELSMQLNIDLDAEKIRRQESLARAAATVASWNPKKQQKNNRSKNDSLLNQSSISPYLIKTNRKTGEVTNPPLATPVPSIISRPVNPEPSENWDISIEEPSAHIVTPEPPSKSCVSTFVNRNSLNRSRSEKQKNESNQLPVQKLSSLVIEDSAEAIVTQSRGSLKEYRDVPEVRAIDEWAFSSPEKTLPESRQISEVAQPFNTRNHSTDTHTFNIKLKPLPGQLLSSSSSSIHAQSAVCRPTLGSPSMPAGRRKEISEWVWGEPNGERERENPSLPIPSKRGKDDSVVEIPRCFMNDKIKRHVDDMATDRKPTFFLTLHGPRKGFEDPRKKDKIPENPRITEHFSAVKSFSKVKSTDSPRQKQAQFHTSDMEQPNQPTLPIKKSQNYKDITQSSREEYDSVEETDEIISVTPIPQEPISFHHVEDEEENEPFYDTDQESEPDDCIMECTIEKEGQIELEKWGLGDRRPITTHEEELHPSILAYNIHSSREPPHELGYSNAVSTMQGPTEPMDNHEPLKIASSSRIDHPQSSITYLRNWNFPFEDVHCQVTPPSLQHSVIKDQRIKVEPEERRIVAGITADRYNDEIKNKQSDNVQIYKTPFAKRLASSDSSTTATIQLLQRMADLQIVPLADALVNRKFWLMSKIIVVMPTVCHQVHELRSDGVDWLFQITVTDTSAARVKCRVATNLLSRLFGFSVQQCKNLFNSNKAEELRAKKSEAERKLVGFNRLDLLIWIELPPEHDKLPLVVDVKTISDALNIL